jgi:lactate dehydrogenase-like 2-hydroxyacid dehydrogenase
MQNNMPRVLITVSELVYQEGPSQAILRDGGFEVAYPPRGVSLYDADRLIEHLNGVDAILAGMEPLNRRVLFQSSLRAIARFGVGYDAIDVPAATERGIAVVNTPGANQESAAEHAFALLLGIVRGFPAAIRAFEADDGIAGNPIPHCGERRSAWSALAASAKPWPKEPRPSAFECWRLIVDRTPNSRPLTMCAWVPSMKC